MLGGAIGSRFSRKAEFWADVAKTALRNYVQARLQNRSLPVAARNTRRDSKARAGHKIRSPDELVSLGAATNSGPAARPRVVPSGSNFVRGEDQINIPRSCGSYCLVRRPKRKRLTPAFVRHFHRPRFRQEAMAVSRVALPENCALPGNGHRVWKSVQALALLGHFFDSSLRCCDLS